MATTTQEVSSNNTNGILHRLSRQMNKVTKVYIRLMFLRVGEIDTLNEKYQAHAAIQARWPVDIDKLTPDVSSDDQKRLLDGKSITLANYAASHWHPQLYIENAIGDLKEQIRYSAKQSKVDNQVYVCEYRDVKGLFWEKLELQHFPSDVQDLSISIGTMFYNDKVILVSDPYHPSGVNREAFIDQQEWKLYQHVDTEQRFIKEFIFQAVDKDDDDDDDEYDGDDDGEEGDIKNSDERARSIITVTCHAARRSNYFFWNGYALILAITLVSFSIFAIPPNLAANRIQISCTLLLTSITFRWTVNRSLPTISYLTSMDMYAMICIFTLVIQCFWHAIIGSLIFLNTTDNRLTPRAWFVTLDHYILLASICLFIAMHIGLITWLFLVPLKHRKNMRKRDAEYEMAIFAKKNNGKKSKKSNSFSRIPIDEKQ